VEFHKILVPVVGTEADEEAIRLACRLTKKNKGRIWAVYVITIKRTLPLDAEMEPEIKKAEAILDHMEMVAEEEDCEIETDLLQAREAAPAIVDEAVERQVDLILMGVTYGRRFGQFSLGNVVPDVLKNAPCRVILNHHRPTE
jgi:nucleotide-binding universal stress UspA family protein